MSIGSETDLVALASDAAFQLSVKGYDATVRILELVIEARQFVLALPQLIERAQEFLVLLLNLY